MNINSLVTDGLGREIFSFGGRTSWKTHVFRGYYVSLEWFIGSQSTEPMLCIQAARRSPDMGMLGICLSSIGKYADQSGNATSEALQLCRNALPTLGKAKLEIEAKTLLDVILNFTSDLIKMPPAPLAVRREEVRAPLIEIELRDESSGKVQAEVSV